MKRILLDTDVGTDTDDALAIALAAACPEMQLEGVTTVHADAPLRARIARRLLDLAGQPAVPVVTGASYPLAPALPASFHWHPHLWGHEGRGILEDQDLQPSADLEASADDAARFIAARVAAAPGQISLVAIGPLTNLARALLLEPRLRDWVRDVTLMGGMIDAERTPWPPVLETNLNADPEAARIVFSSGLPLTIVPFEVTTQVFLTPWHRATMRAWDHPLTNALVASMEQMLARFDDFSRRMNLPRDIFAGQRTYLHDPLAVYVSMETQGVTMQRRQVRLEVRDQVLRTIPRDEGQPTVSVCAAVDASRFIEVFMRRLASLSKRISIEQSLDYRH